MKILNVNQIHQADAFTIENEPITSINLMERAGKSCADSLIHYSFEFEKLVVFVGVGNNGGDGLVIARILFSYFSSCSVFVVGKYEDGTNDFMHNYQLLKEECKVAIYPLNSINEFPTIDSDTLVIDAIFGSGLNRPVVGFFAEIIRKINDSQGFKVSIDMPSGLMADEIFNIKNGEIIKANQTLSLQFPKYSMLLAETQDYVGDLQIIDIDLHPDFIDQVNAKAILVDYPIAGLLLKNRPKFSHKGNYGHALLIAGSKNKSGAALLAAMAAMRSGVGLLTVHSVEKTIDALRITLPEAMLSVDKNVECFSQLPDISSFNSIGIGPGLGVDAASANSFKLLIQNTQNPLVIDADALNILAENKTWLAFLPSGSVLTPHPKEFDRLAGNSNNSFQRIEKQLDISKKFGLFIVLKGAHSTISCPDGTLYFNNSGNPGMSTAGSGDVLTGVILSLLAQQYSAHDASVLGVFVHGLAGDLALKKQSVESLIASDIVSNLGKAFDYIRKNRTNSFLKY